MNKYSFLIVLSLLLFGCGGEKDESALVVFERTDTVAPFVESVDHIELIPLESEGVPSVGVRSMFHLDGTGFLVMDSQAPRVFRFGADGSFLNVIVQEEVCLESCDYPYNVQVLDDEVTVFSLEGIRSFGKDGRLLREGPQMEYAGQSWIVPEGILRVYGYGVGPERAALTRPDGTREIFLPTDAKLISLTPGAPVFSTWDGTTYFIDSYSPVVQSYREGAVTEALSFDFGAYRIPDKAFQLEDAYTAMEYILALPGGFALLRRYLRNDRYQFVDVVLNRDLSVEFCYGFNHGGDWKWFSLGNGDASPFADSQMDLDGNALYFLLRSDALAAEGHGLDGDLEPLRALISNPEVLEGIRPDDNPVVARIVLK